MARLSIAAGLMSAGMRRSLLTRSPVFVSVGDSSGSGVNGNSGLIQWANAGAATASGYVNVVRMLSGHSATIPISIFSVLSNGTCVAIVDVPSVTLVADVINQFTLPSPLRVDIGNHIGYYTASSLLIWRANHNGVTTFRGTTNSKPVPGSGVNTSFSSADSRLMLSATTS